MLRADTRCAPRYPRNIASRGAFQLRARGHSTSAPAPPGPGGRRCRVRSASPSSDHSRSMNASMPSRSTSAILSVFALMTAMLDAARASAQVHDETARDHRPSCPLWRRLTALALRTAGRGRRSCHGHHGLPAAHPRPARSPRRCGTGCPAGAGDWRRTSCCRGSRGGQSLGMRAWRLHLCTDARRRAGVGATCCASPFAAAPLLLLALACAAIGTGGWP